MSSLARHKKPLRKTDYIISHIATDTYIGTAIPWHEDC